MKYLILVLSFCLSEAAFAQHLKRKGFIGVAPEPVGESVAKFLGLAPNEGVIIKMVVPGSTAEKLGIKDNDVILRINGQAVNSPKQVIDIAATLYEGDALRLELNRNKEKLEKSGTVVARSMGYPEETAIELNEFAWGNGHIRTMLFRPKNKTGKLPVIYFVQGYPCFSMQYLPPDFPYRTAINALVKKGYAVFVTEKPGMGDGTGTAPCSQVGFKQELDVFSKGYEQLLTLNGIDASRIFLFGHSLGGFIAPLLAEKYKPKGVVVYGCGVQQWHDYLVDLIREQSPLQGKDYGEAEDNLNKAREVLYQYFFESKTPSQLVAADPGNAAILKEVFQFDGKDQLTGRHYSFWPELNAFNLASAWKNTDAPVLSIFGESDIAALKATDMERIAEIVNHYHPGKGKYLFVPGTNHDMIKTGTMKENTKIQFSPGYNQYLKNNFNYELIDTIDRWIQEQQ
jgi:pimeloyl-ACP methyl ester carboxylesterase